MVHDQFGVTRGWLAGGGVAFSRRNCGSLGAMDMMWLSGSRRVCLEVAGWKVPDLQYDLERYP
jgi:hypothetical protein